MTATLRFRHNEVLPPRHESHGSGDVESAVNGDHLPGDPVCYV